MFPEKADIYAGNNSTALFAVEMKEEGGGGERRERRRGGNRKEIKERREQFSEDKKKLSVPFYYTTTVAKSTTTFHCRRIGEGNIAQLSSRFLISFMEKRKSRVERGRKMKNGRNETAIILFTKSSRENRAL